MASPLLDSVATVPGPVGIAQPRQHALCLFVGRLVSQNALHTGGEPPRALVLGCFDALSHPALDKGLGVQILMMLYGLFSRGLKIVLLAFCNDMVRMWPCGREHGREPHHRKRGIQQATTLAFATHSFRWFRVAPSTRRLCQSYVCQIPAFADLPDCRFRSSRCATARCQFEERKKKYYTNSRQGVEEWRFGNCKFTTG